MQKVSLFSVSVIILNYNGNRYLDKLFASLNNQSLSEFEIVFIDNASSDDSVSIAKHLCSMLRRGITMRIVESKENTGYCRGNNIGALASTGDYLVFLNNDTYLDIHWLEELVEAARLHSKMGIVGSKVVNPLQQSSTENLAFACDFYGQTEGSPIANLEETRSFTEVRLFYCSGACFLISRRLFFEVGAFDEALFMYHDDTDLCWRVRLSGYSLGLALSSVCYHLSKSTDSGLALPVWKYYHGIVKNRLRLLIKNYSTLTFLKYVTQSLTLISLRGVLSSATNRDIRYMAALTKGLYWNIANLRDTLTKKYSVTSIRKRSDGSVQEFMAPHSLEITYFKKLLAKT